jgi:hypothetical protein
LPHGKPGQARLLGRGRRFLTHSTSLRAGSERRLWLWLGLRREWSRVDGGTTEAGFTQFKLRGSRAGLVLGIKAGLGEQFVPSPFYLCEGGQPELS